ncbi:MAG TPA: hypothetical protein VGB04_05340 [Allosphingosinicella sp.]|jgi:hypothetical protein
MARELAEIPDDSAALAFAAGCLRAIVALAVAARLEALLAFARAKLSPLAHSNRSIPTMTRLFTRPRRLGLLCGAVAVAMGMAYMAAAGAPSRYLLMNLAALVLGASLWLALGRAAGSRLAAAGPAVLALAAALLLTALFGTSVQGASRWVSVGPLSLQISLIVLPVMIVLHARKPDAIGTAGMIVAAAALAAQPDRGMAGVLAAALLVLAVSRPGRAAAVAAAASAAGFGWTLLRPDSLPAVPYVDRVLYTAFDIHPLAGVAVAMGAAALVVPVVGAWKAGSDRSVLLAFGGCWSAVIVAAALGNSPTPLVGYGGSAVLGYLLSVALLPNLAGETAAGGALATQRLDDGSPDEPLSELCALPSA